MHTSGQNRARQPSALTTHKSELCRQHKQQTGMEAFAICGIDHTTTTDDDEEGGAELLLDGYSVLERDISNEKNEAPKIKSENLVTAGDGRDLVSRSACWCSVGMNLKRMFIDLTQPRT